MGLRGPVPKPTAMRILNGNPSRRPLPAREPQYSAGLPLKPAGMSAGARKIWDELASEMAAAGVLRPVDAGALMTLCEDVFLMSTLRKGLAQMARAVAAEAKKQGKPLVGGPMVQLSQTIEGRRTLTTILQLTTQIIVQRREFGLTPSSNSRVEASGGHFGVGLDDPLEAALCGGPDESLPN